MHPNSYSFAENLKGETPSSLSDLAHHSKQALTQAMAKLPGIQQAG
jgi:hypothetical protein